MENKFSFYLQQENSLFKGKTLAICYKADQKEIEEYGLTSENILLFIKNKAIDNFIPKKSINYFSEIKKMFHKKDIFLRLLFLKIHVLLIA